jgi:hypothetical protein
MKQQALEALQSVRTLLAYQLTPEAVSELLEPIQKALGDLPNITAHNVLARDAETRCSLAMRDSASRGYVNMIVEHEALQSIRSLRL